MPKRRKCSRGHHFFAKKQDARNWGFRCKKYGYIVRAIRKDEKKKHPKARWVVTG